MKFSSSPAVKLSIAGGEFVFQQDNDSFEVGTSVWPCSLVLAKFADLWIHKPDSPYSSLLSFANKRAIELGAGCGPAGLSFARLGLEITLTDIPAVLPALKRNLRRNMGLLPRKPKVCTLYWNNEAQMSAVKPPFDIVIAADVVYIEDSARQLVSAMGRLCKEDGVVLLGYQVRSVEADQVFWEELPKVFPVVEKIPREHLHPEYAFEEVDLYVLKKRP